MRRVTFQGITAVDHLEMEEAFFTLPINPNNFPAKLWCLVNNPKNRSIHWDHTGQGIIINQQLFETELLSPVKSIGEPIFKTTNFTSFIRQLNLYGFRKVELSPGSADKLGDGDLIITEGVQQQQHRFQNPNFKRDHPELLVNLKRLTTSNKAKLEAGLEVNCRPPSRIQRLLSNAHEEDKSKIAKHGSVFVGQVRRGFHNGNSPPYQYHPNRPHSLKGYDRTPIPQRAWVVGHGDSASPTTFFTDKGIPVSVIQRFPNDTACSAQSSPTTKHVQQGSQGLLAPGQKYNNFIPHHAQFGPGFYTTVCQCCSSGSVNPNMTACVHQPTSSFSQYNYYQPNYSMGFLHPGSQDWQNSGNEDVKKNDVNLETVFQIVDELQVSPKPSMVKVESPEESEVTSASEQELSTTVSLSTIGTAGSTPETVSQNEQERRSPSQESGQSAPLDFSQRVLKNVENLSRCLGKTLEACPSEPSCKLEEVSTSPSKTKDRNTRQQKPLDLLVEVACKQQS
ncbi:heat shock factor protein 5 isoform X2 [Anguilla anguilla]|uniref:heat shock factor protein 5 isoform X2 n=1 Tax=Anguilla anguilla TaxID=7936 RepID=UPI0015B113C2|nr:heat shock factor protein 5 isoform X2 [Anguilla anguilla]